MNFRKATSGEIPAILKIMADGREAQRRNGFMQWSDDYPSREMIDRDIEMGHGFVMLDGDTPAAYVALACGDEEYERLGHIWKEKGRYGVMHRIAISADYQGKGLASLLFDMAEQEIKSAGIGLVRIDTGVENKAMQHILTRRGYTCLGCHSFVWGERFAYERII